MKQPLESSFDDAPRDNGDRAVDRAEALAVDIEAVERAQGGDRGAFARLYRGYGPVVHGIVLARVDASDVADLVQDVFMTALSRLSELREPAAFGGWIVRIARNKAVDFHRRRRPTEELHDDSWVVDGSAPAEALAVLRAFGFSRALVDAGGDLVLGDPPPDAPGWRVVLSTVDTAGRLVQEEWLLAHTAVATSGDGANENASVIQPWIPAGVWASRARSPEWVVSSSTGSAGTSA